MDKSQTASKSQLQLDIEEAQRSQKETPLALKILKWLIVLAVFVFVILGIVFKGQTKHILEGYMEWMSNNLGIGLICYFLLYTLLHTLAVPSIVLTIGIGFVFASLMPTFAALPLASLISWLASSAGCTAAFLNGRYVIRSFVLSWLVYCLPNKQKNKKQKKCLCCRKNTKKDENQGFGTEIIVVLEQIVEERGALVVILLRCNLVLPYNIM